MTSHLAQSESPFAHLGLWRNPFGELDPQERGELAIVDLDRFLLHLFDIHADERLPDQTRQHQLVNVRPPRAIQFHGACGTGKSTHLLALYSHIRQLTGVTGPSPSQTRSKTSTVDGMHPSLTYFPEHGDRPTVPDGRPAFVDEAQRMTRSQLFKMLSDGGPVIVTTHVDLSHFLWKFGYKVLDVDVSEAKTPEQLAAILNQRIDASRTDPTVVNSGISAPRVNEPAYRFPRLSPAYCSQLSRRFGANLRAVDDYLYSSIQTCALERKAWLPVF